MNDGREYRRPKVINSVCTVCSKIQSTNRFKGADLCQCPYALLDEYDSWDDEMIDGADKPSTEKAVREPFPNMAYEHKRKQRIGTDASGRGQRKKIEKRRAKKGYR